MRHAHQGSKVVPDEVWPGSFLFWNLERRIKTSTNPSGRGQLRRPKIGRNASAGRGKKQQKNKTQEIFHCTPPAFRSQVSEGKLTAKKVLFPIVLGGRVKKVADRQPITLYIHPYSRQEMNVMLFRGGRNGRIH